MSSLLRDLRYSCRKIIRRPATSLLAILTIALGIGCTTAVFSVVNAVLLRTLPFKDPGQLVMIWETNASRGENQGKVSPPILLDWREQNEVFEGAAGFWPNTTNLTIDAQPEKIQVADVTADFFKVLGANAQIGRFLEPGEDGRGSARYAVLSHAAWQRRFGADPGVLDRNLDLDGTPHTVIGVMPAHFKLPADVEIWRPIGFDPATLGRNARFLSIVARLNEGVSIERAEIRLQELAGVLEQEHPRSNSGWSARVVPLREHLVGAYRMALFVLLGAGGFVLLIAAVNVANLMLARSAAREGELALRVALGSGRMRLARLLLMDGLLTSLLGGLLAFFVVFLGTGVLVAMIPAEIPRLDEVGVDWQVTLFLLGIVLLTGLGVGLGPALRFAWRLELVDNLKSETRGGHRRNRLHALLVIAEVAIALVVLVGAGLLIRSFQHLTNVDPGFETESTLSFNLQLPSSKYPIGPGLGTFYGQCLDNIRAVPGVVSAAGTAFLPLDPTAWNLEFAFEDSSLAGLEDKPSAQHHVVTPGFFQTLGIPLRSGRLLEERDDMEHPAVIVINQTLADRYFPEGDAIGRLISPKSRNFGSLGRMLPTSSFEIVGIVGDVKNAGLETNSEPAMYFSYRQFAYNSFYMLVNTDTEPLSMLESIGNAVRRVDPSLPVSNPLTLEQMVAEKVLTQRFSMLLLTAFAAVALVLAAVGIYGVVRHGVDQRQREIAVRMVMGGERSTILGLVLRQGLILAAVGLAFGVVVSLLTSRFLADLLFEVRPNDPGVLVAIASILLLVSFLASLIPALRATRIDPMTVLRYE